MKRKIVTVAALITVLTLLFTIMAYGMPMAEITFIQGKSFVGTTKDGPWRALTKGMSVTQGQLIKTSKTGIVEITLPGKSLIRLAPGTLCRLDEAIFPKQKRSKFIARLFFGKIWARISKAMGVGRGSFDIKTPTAIVGVRGTVYNVYAALDRSTQVSVYYGLVGVSPPIILEGAKREEMPWPVEVTEKKWEEIILKRLQRLYIGSDGMPEKPESFDPVKEKDEWADWNLKRDALQTGLNVIENSPSG